MMEKYVKLQSDFLELYGEGLIGVSESGIHMREDYFFEIFGTYKKGLTGAEKYAYKYSAIFNGVNFYCISSDEHDDVL